MQIQPSFWVKLRRLCTQHLGQEDPLRLQIEGMIDRMRESARGGQHEKMAGLCTMLGRLPNAVELGFLIGERVPVTAYGVLSLGLLTAPTIGDALWFVAHVHSTEIPLVHFGYEETVSDGRFTIGFRCSIDRAGEALIVAMCTAAVEGEIARRSGRTGNFVRVELTPSSKDAAASYRKCLSLMPNTDGKSNTLILGRAVLELPNPHADIDTFNSVVQACTERAELRARGASLRDRVREAIMSSIGAPPSQERLAKTLDLTPRQLRVGLERERTSYQAIMRDCRTAYASGLLRNPSLSLSQIADRLGYSELSAFSHAFCRWTGKSPSAFRIEMLPGGECPEVRHSPTAPEFAIDSTPIQICRAVDDHGVAP
jgi:AraC-like DNA-binding protein